MASKTRQSIFGGFFGSSLNLVVFPFFIRLRSSGGYDADDVTSQRVGDEKHAALDKTDGIEAHLAGATNFVELDHIWVQEDLGGGSEIDAVLLDTGSFL